MEQKDFVSREIEKISVMLQNLIGKFFSSKTIQEQQTTEVLINKELLEQSGIILILNQSDFDFVLSKNKGFTFKNTELLADLLFTLGNNEFSKNLIYLSKAFELYTYVDQKSKTFSLDRITKINTLKSNLKIS